MIFAKLTEWNMSTRPHYHETYNPESVTLEVRLIVIKGNADDVAALQLGTCFIVNGKEYDEFLHWKTNKAITEP